MTAMKLLMMLIVVINAAASMRSSRFRPNYIFAFHSNYLSYFREARREANMALRSDTGSGGGWVKLDSDSYVVKVTVDKAAKEVNVTSSCPLEAYYKVCEMRTPLLTIDS